MKKYSVNILPANPPIHVTPVDDLKPHKESVDCKCEPTIKVESGTFIIIHNAYDGRE